MFLVIHKKMNFVVLAEIVAFLTKSSLKSSRKLIMYPHSFSLLNLEQTSSLIAILKDVIKLPKINLKIVEIVK